MAWGYEGRRVSLGTARSMGCLTLLALMVGAGYGMASPVTSTAVDNTGLGYLDTPSLAPGHILRASPLFAGPQYGMEGDWQTALGVHWANIWNYDQERYRIDGEWYRIEAKVSYAISDNVSVGGLAPVIGRTGGGVDSLIEGAHRSMNSGSAGRQRFPRNESVVEIRRDGVVQTLAKGDDWGLGDLAGFVVWRASPGGAFWPALTLQLVASLPTGDEAELQGLGEPSVSVGGVASKRLWGSHVLAFAGLGFSYGRVDDFEGITLYRDEYSGLVGLSYECSSSLALFVQNLSTSRLAEDYGAFSDRSHELSAGFKWRTDESSMVEFAIEENILEFRNSPDIGAHLCWSTAWR